jgi:hypothetical protein
MPPLVTMARPAPRWRWPIDILAYDRSTRLLPSEAAQIHELIERFDTGAMTWPRGARDALARLLAPLHDTLDYTGAEGGIRFLGSHGVACEMDIGQPGRMKWHAVAAFWS